MMNQSVLAGASWICLPESLDKGALKNHWQGGPKKAEITSPLKGLPLFRRSFSVCGALDTASVTFTALGIVELWCNGRRVGSDALKPGFTDFNRRALSFTYDLAPYLTEGENCILAAVSGGWLSGRISFGSFGM
ncbi:MAG: alpha-L-rhamnosidase N-terminal domain-containing protein, partial [Clostridia bacterium]|nr:alpha-L-rhamnosidase N-terminal domain-containing protein [Clostridia bacterium]